MSRICYQGHKVVGHNKMLNNRCRACMNLRKLAHKRRTYQLPPSTEAVLSAYKEPLTPVKDGFGYYGTVAYDKTQRYTQCHICGYFQKHLALHVRKLHGLKSADYRKKYGLALRKSLIAPEERKKYLKMWENYTPEQKAEKIANLKKSQSHGFYGKPRPKSLEQKNVEGTCPDQILDKIQKLTEKLGHTPSRRAFQREYGHSQALVESRFGSWSNALDILKLDPAPSGLRPQYTHANVIKLLQDFKITHGREPYSSDQRGEYLPSAWVTTRLFGSWSNAKKLAFGEKR